MHLLNALSIRLALPSARGKNDGPKSLHHSYWYFKFEKQKIYLLTLSYIPILLLILFLQNYLKNPSKSWLRHSISLEKKYYWESKYFKGTILFLEKVFHLLILSGQISSSSLFGNASLLFRAQITSISQTTPCHNFGS